MTTKPEFINRWTTDERFKNVDKQVITFIANVLYHNNCSTECDAIYSLFASGYCYYFAFMLKQAFNRGEVMWHRGYGHIVWLDANGVAYDIGGVFYDYAEGELATLEELDEHKFGVDNFKHIPEV